MEDMGMVDNKPIESVQASLSFFEVKGDQKKNRLTGMDVSDFRNC